MFAKKLQNGFEKLRVQRFNKKPREQKAKNNGIEVKSTQYKKLAPNALHFTKTKMKQKTSGSEFSVFHQQT